MAIKRESNKKTRSLKRTGLFWWRQVDVVRTFFYEPIPGMAQIEPYFEVLATEVPATHDFGLSHKQGPALKRWTKPNVAGWSMSGTVWRLKESSVWRNWGWSGWQDSSPRLCQNSGISRYMALAWHGVEGEMPRFSR